MVGMDHSDDGGCIAEFVSSCSVSVYMVIWWVYQVFSGYNLGITPLGKGIDPSLMVVVWLHFVTLLRLGMDPRGDGGYIVTFNSSCPVSVYMFKGWGYQPFRYIT